MYSGLISGEEQAQSLPITNVVPVEPASPNPATPDLTDPRDRRARVVAISSITLLAAASIGLYAWIQTRDAADTIPGESLLSATVPQVGQGGPEEGEAAPPFEVGVLGGGTFALEDHITNDGRPVFLNLWASWCAPCRAEMPAIDAAAARHPGVAFVGVAVRDPDYTAVAAFAEEIDVSYTIAYDREDEVADAYPVLGMPATFLISETGLVLHRRFGQLPEDEIDGFIATFFGG